MKSLRTKNTYKTAYLFVILLTFAQSVKFHS